MALTIPSRLVVAKPQWQLCADLGLAWNRFKKKGTWTCLALEFCWVSDEKDRSRLNRGRSEEKGVELRSRSLELRGQDAEWDIEETQKAAGGSVNGDQGALGRDSEERGMWMEGDCPSSRDSHPGGGAVEEDRIFRVEPASRKGKKMERMFCADMEHGRVC